MAIVVNLYTTGLNFKTVKVESNRVYIYEQKSKIVGKCVILLSNKLFSSFIFIISNHLGEKRFPGAVQVTSK